MDRAEYDALVISELRRAFVEKYQDDGWQITDARVCTDERYLEWGRMCNVVGTYTVEITAVRDIDGYNKYGAYCKMAEGDRVLYTVWTLESGKVVDAGMQVLPVRPLPAAGPLTIYASEDSATSDFVEICHRYGEGCDDSER